MKQNLKKSGHYSINSNSYRYNLLNENDKNARNTNNNENRQIPQENDNYKNDNNISIVMDFNDPQSSRYSEMKQNGDYNDTDIINTKNVINNKNNTINDDPNDTSKISNESNKSNKSKKLKKNKKSTFERFKQLAKPERKTLTLALIVQVLQVIGQLSGPAYTGVVIHIASTSSDSLFKWENQPFFISFGCQIDSNLFCDTNIHILYTVICEFLIFAAFTGIMTFFASSLKRIAGVNILVNLRLQLFESLIYQDISLFDETGTGELLNRLSSDITKLGDVISYELINRFGSLCLLIGCITYTAFISIELFIASLIVYPVVALVSREFGKYFKKQSKKTQDILAKNSQIANETFSNIRCVRAFSNERYHISEYNDSLEVNRKIGYSLAYARGSYRMIGTFIDNIGLAVVLTLGAWLILKDRNNHLNVSTFTTFILYSNKINSNMKQMFELYSSMQTAIGSSLRVFDYIERVPCIDSKCDDNDEKNSEINDDGQFNGEILFDNVTFAYETRADTIVLNQLNLLLKPNTTTALVGISGSGKSTIASLIMRFYDPIEGCIYVDNIPMKKLNLKLFHQNAIGIVSQEPVLFSGTILENIKYGISVNDDKNNNNDNNDNNNKENVDQSVIQVAKLANAHDFIMQFDNGYQTQVGERGVQLSGGQKQRIAIARALLKKPTVLILDEATSALDSESEALVDQALKTLIKETKTVLIIAHRFSTIKNADNIVVLQKGNIVEMGTHNQLVSNQDSLYAFLFNRQIKFGIDTIE